MQKYIINQSKISSKLIKSLNGLKFDQYTNQLIGLEENIDDLLELKDGSDVLVPVFFNKGLEGNYSIESSFIKENLLTPSFKNLNFYYIYFYDGTLINFKALIDFSNGSSGVECNEMNSLIFDSSISQKSMLEQFSNKIMCEDSSRIFFKIFLNLTYSGTENPNIELLVLEKLDKLDQQLEEIRLTPFFLRTNSISYRLINPFVVLSKSIIERIISFKNLFINKSTNYSKRKLARKIKDERIDKFLKISTKKIDNKTILLVKDEDPKLSIVIPVYGKLDFLARCLHSIQEAKINIAYEVIVVDDLGPQKVSNKFNANKNGFILLENEANLGFTGTCNAGALIAKGEYICFLNSDTIVTDLWADNLLNGFSLADNVGIVGSKLIYEDGSLQEAGGIIFSNGDAANIGKNKESDSSWYKYFKDVDYVSGAALAILKEDFDKLGGFDDRFSPAYYEDTSLCMDVRHKLNKRVTVNPLSIVIHHEGATNGKDENAGFKKFMSINKRKFIEKHAKELRSYGLSFENIARDRDKYLKGNVLIIDQCIPTPKEDSGSKDMDNILRALIAQNMRPHLFALSNRGETSEAFGYYEKGVHCVFGKENISFEKFFKENHSLFTSIIISRVNSYEEVHKVINKYAPDTKKIFYTVDLHHVRLETESNITNNAEIRRLAKRTELAEIQAIEETHNTVVLSENEKKYLIDKYDISSDKILVWPLIRNEFESLEEYKKTINPKDIIFIGGYRHTPNIEAVKLLKDEIVPRAVEIFKNAGMEFPGIKLYGSSPTEFINSINERHIKYMGFIDLESDAFKNARMSVAPLPFGAGLKGKTLSSLIYKTPIVGTSFAFEGFDETNNNIMLESSLDPNDFAQKIFDCYKQYDHIPDKEWDDLLLKLDNQFSYKSFLHKIKNDLEL
mgnify:CR=1 FL=1|jgi:GT2 family glycosyltransferase